MTFKNAKTKAYESMANQDYDNAIAYFEIALDSHPFNDNSQEGKVDFEKMLQNHTACVNTWLYSK